MIVDSDDAFISLQGKDKETVKGILKEMSISMSRSEAEREHMKNMIDRLKKDHAIPPAIARKAAKVYHAQLYNETVSKANMFTDFYQCVFDLNEEDVE